jgi:hypothetical protein
MEVTGEFIRKLRNHLKCEFDAMQDSQDYDFNGTADALSAFDRAALAVVLDSASAPAPLTRGQKAARTRALNRNKANGSDQPAEVQL